MACYFGQRDRPARPIRMDVAKRCRARNFTNLPNARFCTTCLQHAAAGCSRNYPAHPLAHQALLRRRLPASMQQSSSGWRITWFAVKCVPLDGSHSALSWQEKVDCAGSPSPSSRQGKDRHLNTARPAVAQRSDLSNHDGVAKPAAFRLHGITVLVRLFATKLCTIGVAIHGRSLVH